MLVTTLSPETAGVVFNVPATWPVEFDLEFLATRGSPQVGLVLVLETRLPERVTGLVALRGPRGWSSVLLMVPT